MCLHCLQKYCPASNRKGCILYKLRTEVYVPSKLTGAQIAERGKDLRDFTDEMRDDEFNVCSNDRGCYDTYIEQMKLYCVANDIDMPIRPDPDTTKKFSLTPSPARIAQEASSSDAALSAIATESEQDGGKPAVSVKLFPKAKAKAPKAKSKEPTLADVMTMLNNMRITQQALQAQVDKADRRADAAEAMFYNENSDDEGNNFSDNGDHMSEDNEEAEEEAEEETEVEAEEREMNEISERFQAEMFERQAALDAKKSIAESKSKTPIKFTNNESPSSNTRSAGKRSK